MNCPVCGRKSIGKVGIDQFYCWECCVEFAYDGDACTVFNVEADGTLSLYTNPQPVVSNYEEGVI